MSTETKTGGEEVLEDVDGVGMEFGVEGEEGIEECVTGRQIASGPLAVTDSWPDDRQTSGSQSPLDPSGREPRRSPCPRFTASNDRHQYFLLKVGE